MEVRPPALCCVVPRPCLCLCLPLLLLLLPDNFAVLWDPLLRHTPASSSPSPSSPSPNPALPHANSTASQQVHARHEDVGHLEADSSRVNVTDLSAALGNLCAPNPRAVFLVRLQLSSTATGQQVCVCVSVCLSMCVCVCVCAFLLLIPNPSPFALSSFPFPSLSLSLSLSLTLNTPPPSPKCKAILDDSTYWHACTPDVLDWSNMTFYITYCKQYADLASLWCVIHLPTAPSLQCNFLLETCRLALFQL